MSSENDVPLGDESRRYYEQQFGDRIRQVKKGGAPAPKDGGSNGYGRAGCGGVVAIFIVIRIVIALLGSRSNSPSYNYTPPQIQFDAGLQKQFNAPGNNVQAKEEIPGDLEEALRQLAEINKANFGGANANGPDAQTDLTKADVPLPEGLCYRICQASLQLQPSPGKHIWQMLEPSARKLIVKSAKGEVLDRDQESELLESLSGLLDEAQFYDPPSFREVPGIATLILLHDNGNHAGRGTQRFNRLLLEQCYPKQIVPLAKRGQMDIVARVEWLKQARLDLDQARREFKPNKR